MLRCTRAFFKNSIESCTEVSYTLFKIPYKYVLFAGYDKYFSTSTIANLESTEHRKKQKAIFELYTVKGVRGYYYSEMLIQWKGAEGIIILKC